VSVFKARDEQQRKKKVLPPDVQGALAALSDRFGLLCNLSKDPALWPPYVWSSGKLNDRPGTPDSTFRGIFSFLLSTLGLEFRREHQPKIIVHEDWEDHVELPSHTPISEELMVIGRRLQAKGILADSIAWAKEQAGVLVHDHRRSIQNLMRVACDGAGKRLTANLLDSLTEQFISGLKSRIKEEADAAYLEAAKAEPPAKSISITGKVEGKGRAKKVRRANPEEERRIRNKLKKGLAIRKSEAATLWRVDRGTIGNWVEAGHLKLIEIEERQLITPESAKEWLTKRPPTTRRP
jgi:hypothetical protein